MAAGEISPDEVAAEAGVSKQTVYNHFGSKEGLFRAIVDHVSGELLDVLVEREGARAVRIESGAAVKRAVDALVAGLGE
jgi:AcrR family transcriptional regulator